MRRSHAIGDGTRSPAAYLHAMKKHTTKLPVSRETLRTLDAEAIGHVKGAEPVSTRDLPCIPPPRD